MDKREYVFEVVGLAFSLLPCSPDISRCMLGFMPHGLWGRWAEHSFNFRGMGVRTKDRQNQLVLGGISFPDDINSSGLSPIPTPNHMVGNRVSKLRSRSIFIFGIPSCVISVSSRTLRLRDNFDDFFLIQGGKSGASLSCVSILTTQKQGRRVVDSGSRRERLSDSEEKPPQMAAKANEGGSEEASRRLASGEKGRNRAVRRKSDRLLYLRRRDFVFF